MEWALGLGGQILGCGGGVNGDVGVSDVPPELLREARGLELLVEKWCELVVSGGRERQPGQISTLLAALGPMPAASHPDERALWVAALLNPLPALGVALEIRSDSPSSTSQRHIFLTVLA